MNIEMKSLNGYLSILLIALLTGFTGTASAQNVEGKEPNRGGSIDLRTDSPEMAMNNLVVPEGYQVSLFASEKEFPELKNPVSMAFDAKGRLWVATMPSYPQRLPDQLPDDRIIILEDTDGDGKADTVKTFIGGLHVPTGLALGNGGAYIGAQPNLLFAKDTDGDDVADVTEKVLHGFGSGDSHHSISAFTFGPGGGLYLHEGTFHRTQVETPWGPTRVRDASVFRYEPNTQKLDIFVSYNFANPWGHVFDKYGSNFIADASGGANYFGTALSGYLDYPTKHVGMQRLTSVVRPTAGCELISSRNFPDEVQGDFLVNNCIGFQGVKWHRLREKDSGYWHEWTSHSAAHRSVYFLRSAIAVSLSSDQRLNVPNSCHWIPPVDSPDSPVHLFHFCHAFWPIAKQRSCDLRILRPAVRSS